VLGLGSFSSFDFEHHCIGFSFLLLLLFFFKIFGSFGFFFMPLSFVWAPSMIENFLLCPPVLFEHFQSLMTFSCPQELFGHFQSLWIFWHLPPRVIWAFSIIMDFLALTPQCRV
jgi:hypothetical protein